MAAYFDHNATTPMLDAAREEWLRVETSHWHNPSSLYREAGVAKRLLEDCREEVADRLGSDNPARVVFTSGATEANNAVLRFAAAERGRVAISAVEHPSVRDAAKVFIDERIEIPVDEVGVVEIDAVTAALGQDGLALMSVMAANNETGVVQRWREVAAACREAGVPFHCDAAQWIGKLPADGLAQCDFVTGCAHKFGGPKGVGFMLLAEDLASGSSKSNFVVAVGGPQENRHRAGTEDLPGIAAMMAAWRAHDESLGSQAAVQAAADRDGFEARVTGAIPSCQTVPSSREVERLWNTSMIVVPAHNNLKWLTRLSRRGFCVSTGSACSAGQGNPSHVMAAMGLDAEAMGRVIRVSGGWDSSAADWQAMADALIEVWQDLESGERAEGGLSESSAAGLFGPAGDSA